MSVHYLGMLALVFPGSIQYNAGLSVIAAVIAYLLGECGLKRGIL